MAALSDFEVLSALKNKELVIEPLNYDNVQPGSIDLTLFHLIDCLRPDPDFKFDPSADSYADHVDTVDLDNTEFWLQPGCFVTGASQEHIKLPQNVNGLLANRNSLIRVGLDASVSCYINPGFEGRKTIVIRNIGPYPIRLVSKMRICQLVLFRLGHDTLRFYSERHATNKLEAFIQKELDSQAAVSNKHVDSSLSDYMNKRISELAEAM
jgi:deoxycytidine triphosphate deaminase